MIHDVCCFILFYLFFRGCFSFQKSYITISNYPCAVDVFFISFYNFIQLTTLVSSYVLKESVCHQLIWVTLTELSIFKTLVVNSHLTCELHGTDSEYSALYFEKVTLQSDFLS